jgi:hypothetical protein
MVQDSMLRTVKRLSSRITELENQLGKAHQERDDLDAAFTNLSALVMEREPEKWAVWLEAQKAQAQD